MVDEGTQSRFDREWVCSSLSAFKPLVTRHAYAGVNLGLILISTATPTCMFETQQDLCLIEFPAYTFQELKQVLCNCLNQDISIGVPEHLEMTE